MNENAIATLAQLTVAEEPLTTTDIAKRVFGPFEGDTEMRNADRRVRRYVTDTFPHLVEREKREDGASVFAVDGDSVVFGRGKVTVLSGHTEAHVGLGDVLVYENAEGGPEVVSIKYEDIDPDDIEVLDEADVDAEEWSGFELDGVSRL